MYETFVDSAMRTIVSNAKYCLGVRELSDTSRVAGFSVTWRYIPFSGPGTKVIDNFCASRQQVDNPSTDDRADINASTDGLEE
jgi:hypothetical protein